MTDDNTEDFQSDKSESEDNDKMPSLLPVWIMTIVIIFAICLTPIIISDRLFSELKHGEYGDMFGVTNAAFSGLALLGVIYAIILQRHELAAQRKDLKLSRDELKLNRKTMQAHGKTFELQRFENTFFRLLEGLAKARESLSIRKPDSILGKSLFGGECLADIRSRFKIESNFKNAQQPKDFLSHYFRLKLAIDVPQFERYFDLIRNILKFLDEKQDIVSRVHIDSLSAIFSEDDCFLLFYETRLFPGWSDINDRIMNEIIGKECFTPDILLNPTHYNWPIYQDEKKDTST